MIVYIFHIFSNYSLNLNNPSHGVLKHLKYPGVNRVKWEDDEPVLKKLFFVLISKV